MNMFCVYKYETSSASGCSTRAPPARPSTALPRAAEAPRTRPPPAPAAPGTQPLDLHRARSRPPRAGPRRRLRRGPPS